MLNNEYQLINEQKSINWHGDTNRTYIVKLKLETDIETTNLEITSIYYSDREDFGNKLAVDLNNKNDYSLFRKTTIDKQVLGMVR
jgi:hypothetical protein